MTIVSRGQNERLAPCVCNTLRMVARAATPLYDAVLRPSGLRVTQFSVLGTIARRGLLERDRLISNARRIPTGGSRRCG
jgi:hypothetical protein